MNHILLEFDYADKDLAELISNSTPPEGFTVSKSGTFIKASGSTGGAFTQIAIQFAQDVRDVAIAILATWLYKCCEKSGKKEGRINRDKIAYSERSIRRIIKKELKNQRARDAQRRNDKHRPPKKRS